jgi:zinc transport system ATP-binding protein
MAKALEVRNLAIRFGRNEIFRALDFDVEAGSALAVIGPNGAGKTVLFKALAGLIPYEGTVKWAGGIRLGYVPQKLDLERDLPVTGRFYLAAWAHGARRAARDAAHAIAEVRMDPSAADKLIGTLSGGQFQRLLVACALLGRPNALLLDEATAGVDEPGQEMIQEVIRRLQKERGMTVLLISHELRVVYRYADNVLCLARDAAFHGPPHDILTPETLARLYGSEPRYHLHDHDAS